MGKKLPQIVRLHGERLEDAIKRVGSRDFVWLVFITGFCRNFNPECTVYLGELAKRVGVHVRHSHRAVEMLDGKWLDVISRNRDNFTVKIVETEKDEGAYKTILFRVGPKQEEKWRKAGAAMRTLLALALCANRHNVIQTDGMALVELLHSRFGIPKKTAEKHIATLKENKMLFGYSHRLGYLRNAKEWYISKWLLYVRESKPPQTAGEEKSKPPQTAQTTHFLQ